MARYQNLVDIDLQSLGKNPVGQSSKKAARIPKSLKPRGCEHCPANGLPGINKVKNLNKVVGRRAMLWAQNPGYWENIKKTELIGRSGKFLWAELERVGLHRGDFDIQNTVRCRTIEQNEEGDWIDRAPNKDEIRCCSIYNEEALERNEGKAKVHLVLGNVAASALLGKEYRKDQRTFWSKRLGAWVIATYHPAYFLRGAPRSKLKEFRAALQTVAEKLRQKTVGRFSYIESQDYASVPAQKLEEEIGEPLREAARQGKRVVVDIEDGWLDKKTNVIVMVGFSWRRGYARSVFLYHPKVRQRKEDRRTKVAFLKKLLEDPTIKKCLAHGSYDIIKLWKLLGIQLQGYASDAQYSEYLRFSNHKSYALESIADRRFQQFAGYKGYLDEWRDKETGLANMLLVPPKVLVTYNGADCDLCGRIDEDNAGKYNRSLMRVYMHNAFVLDRMELNGPWLDYQHLEFLKKWIPKRLKELEGKIRKIVGDPHFNPRAPEQVATVVYKKLKLQRHLDTQWFKDHGFNTREPTMEQLGKFHEFPGLILEHRKLTKKSSTYMEGTRRSADKWGGRVRTKWWLTGTVTGRLRSGGSKKKTEGIINLQNLPGAPEIECLLVSDENWREVFEAWKKEKRAA